VLEDLAFTAEEQQGCTVLVDGEYVDSRVKSLARDEDLSRFIL